jgi:malate synthase
VRYIDSWLRGVGAAAIFNLMEDAATAEISRSQVRQWIRAGIVLDTGRPVTAELVRELGTEEFGDGLAEARALFEKVALAEEYPEFLTLPAYELID